MMKQFDSILSKIRSIVINAGNTMLDSTNSNLDIQEKTSPKDIVTQYDNRIQNKIIYDISCLISNAQFISEEISYPVDIMSENLFIIDPIDGTTNFIHSIGYSAVSVAWYKKMKPYYGIVYNPYTKEIYEAQCNKGAFLNDERIRVSAVSLKNALVSFGTSPYNLETMDTTFDMIKCIYQNCQDIRRMGSAALDICYVASGKIGLYFEAALSLWDYAAAFIILQEAGGEMYSFSGNKVIISTQKSSVIVGSKEIIHESGLIKWK